MPSLLKTNSPPKDTALTLQVLRSRYRWESWRGVLAAVITGLTVTLAALWLLNPSWHPPHHGKLLACFWSGGLILSALAGVLMRRLAPSSWIETAGEMDRDLDAKNRLETTALQSDSSAPLALAQRDETIAYLHRAAPEMRPVRALPWLIGGVIALIIAHFLTLAIWVIPLLQPKLPVIASSRPKTPKASIIWKSPEPESKANPIEEVPTVAVAQSNSGLQGLFLEITVNGTPKKSVPLPAKPFDQPGTNAIKASLYMDELGVAPFDIVSYFVRARQITTQDIPETTSAIQFIQVRPFRDDVAEEPDAQGTANLNLLIELKSAQVRAVKENFILAHTDVPATNPARVKENNRVGKNQADLSAKTEEVTQAFINTGYPSEMIDLLRQAEEPMDDAAKKILATQNSQAIPSQEKALNLIVEVERFFHKVVTQSKSASVNPVPDPFRDKQQHDLKIRSESTAGQLEQLAKNQAKLAGDLTRPDSSPSSNPPSPPPAEAAAPTPPSSTNPNESDSQKTNLAQSPQAVDPFGPDANQGTPEERETRILQGIETLLGAKSPLSPAVSQALQAAKKDATESVQELGQGNEKDARSPVTNTTQDLQKAVAEMNRAGDEASRQAMAEGQQKLNDLARQLRDLAEKGSSDSSSQLAGLARQLGEARQHLEDAADQQQAAGSASGAERLQNLAKALADQNVAGDLTGMSKTGFDANLAKTDAQNLETLAGQAAQGMNAGKPTAQGLAQLLNSLEKSRVNLVRLAAPGDQGHGGEPKEKSPGQIPAGTQGGSSPTISDANATPSSMDLANGIRPDSTRNNVTTARAYQEVIADLKDDAQQATGTVPSATVNALLAVVIGAEEDLRTHQLTEADRVRVYQLISSPLDKLITDLQEANALAQREEVVRQPDLDQAPAAFRPAVSDYFETMSRDYHPDGNGATPSKP